MLSMTANEQGGKVLVCRKCGAGFTFSKAERKFYAEKNFSEPTTCPDCRRQRRRPVRTLRCSRCGDEVDSAPSVYCQRCLDVAVLEVEFKLGHLQRERSAVESRLAAFQMNEEDLHNSVGRLEQVVSEKESAIHTLRKQCEELSLLNHNFQGQLREAEARQLHITESLKDRERRDSELVAELNDARQQVSEMKLRLDIAQLQLENTYLHAEDHTVHSFPRTADIFEMQAGQHEAHDAHQGHVVNPRTENTALLRIRSLIRKIQCWLRFHTDNAKRV